MTNPAYTLSQAQQAPANSIGQWGSLLAKLAQQSLQLTGGFIIPTQALAEIADHNGLSDLLRDLPRESELVDETCHLYIKMFSKLEIPAGIAHAWLKAFYQQISDQPAYLKASWTSSQDVDLHVSGIKGDANVMESILELWGQTYCQQLRQGQSPQLIPAAIVVQAQPQPQAYGMVQTNLHLPHYKSVVLVRASREPLNHHRAHDDYKVDVRTWHIIESHPDSHHSPILDRDQIIQVARAGYLTKLQHFDHGQLLWSLANQHLTLLHFQTEASVTEQPSLKSDPRVLVAGKGLVPGIVHGRCVVEAAALPTKQMMNAILVTKNLTRVSALQLKHLGGVIAEDTINPQVLAQLKKFHIPTMIKALAATQRLKTGQAVILNSAAGKVLADITPTPTPSGFTKLVIDTQQGMTTQLAQLHPTQVFFRPDYSLVQLGVHPLHLIRSTQRDLLFQSLSEKLQSFRSLDQVFYRISNLSSADLVSLKYGGQYEAAERNPDLGYRGALRSLSQTELFDFELDVLRHTHRLIHQKLNLVLSGIRSPSELKLIQQHVHQVLPDASWLSTWLEVDTPENAINYYDYHRISHQGVVINLTKLHSLAHGIDIHNQDVYRLYTWNLKLLKHLTQHVMDEARHTPVYVICPSEQPEVLKMVLDVGAAGVILKSHYAQQAKEYMMTSVYG